MANEASGNAPPGNPLHTRRASQLLSKLDQGDRAALGRAITLVESAAPHDQPAALALLAAVQATATASAAAPGFRVGITGAPGVGKSTLVNALGSQLTAAGKRVAVLAVDPSSSLSGGSILGDKTRMAQLARDERAFIRPSPSGGRVGGLARTTAEAMSVCEVAGYDVVLVETVGVGQTEAEVKEIVDCFVLLLAPGAGDALQGVKRGVLELTDILVVNKADGEQRGAAEQTRSAYDGALALSARAPDRWPPTTLCASALERQGLDVLWSSVEAHRAFMEQNGQLAELRSAQRVHAMRRTAEEALLRGLHESPEVIKLRTQLEIAVRANQTTPRAAAHALAEAALLQRSSAIGPTAKQ